MKAPEVIYKTTRDNADYGKLHKKQWYGSDEAFHLKQDEYQMWYENEYGETVLVFSIEENWTKENIIQWYVYTFENDCYFRE